MRPHLLLTYDFPPNGGGIARMMGELALRYPEKSLIVSTGMVDGTLLGDAALIVAISAFTRGVALDIFKRIDTTYDPARVVVVPLGTDPAQFRPDVDPAPARKAFDLPAGRWLMTVARLTPHK